jgi:DNA-binding response OmpR family regulator
MSEDVALFISCKNYDKTITRRHLQAIKTSDYGGGRSSYHHKKKDKIEKRTTKGGKKKKRILVVDDENDLNLLLKIVLEDNGFEVNTFNDPLLALDNFKSGLYDLAILDIVMPQMNGFDLCKKIKMMDKKIKVCLLTASELYKELLKEQEQEEVKKVFNSSSSSDNEYRIIVKPIENEALVDQIKAMLKSK